MRAEKRNVLTLAACQALFQTASVLIMTVGGLAGQMLAADKSLATLPIASMSVGTALVTIPASLIMQRAGRRVGFMIGTLLGALGGGLSVVALLIGSFWLFNLGNLLVGAYQGFSQFYRFAAAEVASPEFKSRAISFVLAGGVVAAIAGPHLGNHTRDLLGSGTTFAGSYVTVVVLSLAAMALLGRLQVPPAALTTDTSGARPLAEIVRQPAFVVALTGASVGYGVMILAMTATPLAMVAQHHGVGDAAFVIQWHVLGMFVPSFFTGTLIARFGVLPVMFTGAVLLLGHVTIALSGVALLNFVSALMLLGVGWNFLFIGGTTLLTETYRMSEKGKVQGLNDFLIVGVVVIASFASGGLLQRFGWQGVNMAALPFLLGIAALIAGFALRRRMQPSLGSPG